jgi:regulator of protease activity HflC (stomatin/prohibitin superfamily)
VGVRRRTGKISDDVKPAGLYTVGLFSRITKVPVSTTNLATVADLPTKQELTVQSEMSILYRIDQKKIPDVFCNVGENYEEVVISPVFRSVVRDVSARFMAKDLHTAERSNIEKAIRTK